MAVKFSHNKIELTISVCINIKKLILIFII